MPLFGCAYPFHMSESQAASITVQRRIEWSDTDGSGRWHNTAGFRLIEVAETALLERLGILEAVYDHLPRVRIDAAFLRPLDFRDLVDCSISVVEVGRSSVTYGFSARRGEEVCMTATVTAVLLGAENKPSPWSSDHRNLLLGGGPQRPETLAVS